MPRTWNFMSGNREDDSEFLHHDYQPTTPSSRINLEHRFKHSNVGNICEENQYENWKPENNDGQLFGVPDKIYENQQEILDHNLSRLRRCRSLPKHPPPLPPRNTPARLQHHTTITLETNSSIAASHSFATALVADDDEDEDAMDTGHLNHTTCVPVHSALVHRDPKKYQSRSSSILPRFSVRPFANVEKHTFNKGFNQTFAGGESIYSNLCDEEGPGQGQHNKIAPIWKELQGTVKESKPHASKLFKMSGHKFSQAVQGCRTAFASISQKFRASTQRRYKLDSNSPRSSYATPPHGSIRRTPGKMYSPFNCSTPPPPRGHETKRLQHRPSRVYPGMENRPPRTPRGGAGQETTNVHARLGGVPLDRHHWASFHTPHHTGPAPRPGNAPCSGSTFRPASQAVHAAVAFNDGHELYAPEENQSVKPGNVFHRHLVEFDQMSRNITVSLARNSKFRNSVR